jgi:nicotinamide-nucleotide amidase
MAKGIMKKFNTDFAIATSGIAGPTGATENKPLGTVWICIASKNETISRMYNYGGDRDRNILRSSVTALNLLRLHMKRNIF